MTSLKEIFEAYKAIDPRERKTYDNMLVSQSKEMLWVPNPGPQTAAYFSEADELFYGGAAGGGKSDLLIGLAINEHDVSQIFRLQHNDRVAIVRRLGEILEGMPRKPKGYNGQDHYWSGSVNGQGRIVEFGAMSNPDAWTHYQGRPASLKGWDELPQFSREGYTTVNQWLRSINPNQRCRIVGAGNPPLAPEQFWVVEYWGPWLDPRHENPAADGELRWFTTINGVETEVDRKWRGEGPDGMEIKPMSRTFIRAMLSDNEELAATGYGSRLAGGPLGSLLLEGKFDAEIKDHGNQLIPTEWILAAQDRWEQRSQRDNGRLTAVGVDPNGGGDDEFGIMGRRGTFFDEPILSNDPKYSDPKSGAAFIMTNVEGDPNFLIDCTGGWGNGIVSILNGLNFQCASLSMAKGSIRRTRTLDPKEKSYGFVNKRAEYMWGLREALDPRFRMDVALPPGRRVMAELALPRWKLRGDLILIEPKEEMVARYGKSPTILDSAAYAWAEPDAEERYERRAGGRPGVRKMTRSPVVQTSYASGRAKYSPR